MINQQTEEQTKSQRIEELEHQAAALRERAHSFFMQVIQIQQLHAEEIKQMCEDFGKEKQLLLEKQNMLEQKYACAEMRLQEIENKYAEMSQNCLKFQKAASQAAQEKEGRNSWSSVFDGLESIQHRKEDIDQSSFLHIQDLVSTHMGILHWKQNLLKALSNLHLTQSQLTGIQTIATQPELVIRDLQLQCSRQNTEIASLKASIGSLVEEGKHRKQTAQNLKKQLQFTSEHVRVLAREKLLQERQLQDSQQQCRLLQNSIARADKAKRQSGIDTSECSMRKTVSRRISFYSNKEQMAEETDLLKKTSELPLMKMTEGSKGLMKLDNFTQKRIDESGKQRKLQVPESKFEQKKRLLSCK